MADPELNGKACNVSDYPVSHSCGPETNGAYCGGYRKPAMPPPRGQLSIGTGAGGAEGRLAKSKTLRFYVIANSNQEALNYSFKFRQLYGL